MPRLSLLLQLRFSRDAVPFLRRSRLSLFWRSQCVHIVRRSAALVSLSSFWRSLSSSGRGPRRQHLLRSLRFRASLPSQHCPMGWSCAAVRCGCGSWCCATTCCAFAHRVTEICRRMPPGRCCRRRAWLRFPSRRMRTAQPWAFTQSACTSLWIARLVC